MSDQVSPSPAGQPLIKILRGQWRGLGQTGQGLGLIFDFNFRQYLHLFPGARLHVLMAISLHADEQGRAFPSYDLLERETGYRRDTIARALEDLCSMTIDSNRVLLRYRVRDEAGQFTGSNRYIIFPTPAEIKEFDSPESENPTLDDIQSPKNPQLENATSGKSDSKLIHVKTESSIKDSPVREPEQPEPESIVKNPRALAALQKFEQRNAGQDLAAWPEDCRPVLQVVTDLWGLQLPERPRSGKGGQFAAWINEARALNSACGEYGTSVLYQVHADYIADSSQGRAPFSVARPAALVKVTQAKAAWLRSDKGPGASRPAESKPSLTDHLAQVEQQRAALAAERARMIAAAQPAAV